MNYLFLFEEYELVKSSTEEFIKKANRIHGDKYDYSKVNYIKSGDPVEIICPIHGPFTQSPNAHLKGKGCKKCGTERAALLIRRSKDKFISDAKEIHGDKYDYTKVNYINDKTKVEIICKKHNTPFFPTPSKFIKSKTGCPICSESKGESMISKILEKNGYDFEREKKFSNFQKMRFDFYLKIPNEVCIEYDGIQHFMPIFWGSKDKNQSEKNFETQKERDEIKNQYCKDNNIWLIRVSYKYKTIKEIEDYLIEVGFLPKDLN
jgi:hypothetical protein